MRATRQILIADMAYVQIPPGKVWKIKAISPFITTVIGADATYKLMYYSPGYLIGRTLYFLYTGNQPTGIGSVQFQNLDITLETGYSLRALGGGMQVFYEEYPA